MSNLVKASEYAKFCYLCQEEMYRDLRTYGYVIGYDGIQYTDWNIVIEDCKEQFTSYYEDATLIEQDVSLSEALEMSGLGEQE